MAASLEDSSIKKGRPLFAAGDLREEKFLSEMLHKIGHEMGNPLTSIISLASIIQSAGGSLSEDRLQSYASSINKEAWRISGLNEKLVLLFSTRISDNPICDIEEASRKITQKLLAKGEYKRCDIELRFSSAPMNSRIDSEPFLWLAGAMIENALQACVREAASTNPPEYCDLVEISGCAFKDSIELDVSNFRSHPCSLELSRLFEPFVVESAEHKTTGLGLTVAAAVVQRFGGTLELSEEPLSNGGYRFKVSLKLLPA